MNKSCENCKTKRPDNYTDDKTNKHYYGCSGFKDKSKKCKLWSDVDFESRQFAKGVNDGSNNRN